MGFQSEKSLILRYFAGIDAADSSTIKSTLRHYTSEDWRWYGYYPFNDLNGAKAVASQFWQPLKLAINSLVRRQDIFFAGANEIDGYESTWVVSMGHLMGLFDRPWLGIEPTQKMAMLRYCEFNRITDNRICETAFYCDIPHFMQQAGQPVFNEQTAVHMVQAGPATHDGLLFDDAPISEGEQTLAVINNMIGNLGQWRSNLPIEEELALNWHPDMIWWGPEGIGTTYTIARYAEQHATPFRAAFSDRSPTGHRARLAEGHYGGFFGRPNFTAVHTGGFMGYPAHPDPLEFRVIDIYRRRDNKLAENWVFIDLLYWLKQQGIDLLEPYI